MGKVRRRISMLEEGTKYYISEFGNEATIDFYVTIDGGSSQKLTAFYEFNTNSDTWYCTKDWND